MNFFSLSSFIFAAICLTSGSMAAPIAPTNTESIVSHYMAERSASIEANLASVSSVMATATNTVLVQSIQNQVALATASMAANQNPQATDSS